MILEEGALLCRLGTVGIWKNGTPNRLGRFCIARKLAERLTHSRPPENPTPGGQFHKAVIRLFDRYTQCAKCGCDRPTSDPPECVKQAGDRSTDRSQCVTRVATR